VNFDTILLEKRQRVALITINRPQAMNALNKDVFRELRQALQGLENDQEIGAVVLTGNDKAFAAGADIKAMAGRSYQEMSLDDFTADWDFISQCKKPVIAAVGGYALGGGCEVAMMCDFIIAADNARFGQPEIKIGTMPGIGGSQRLTRLVGKSKAMEMCLTGRMMDAEEAERSGLVARVEPLETYLDSALETAATIAGYSRPVVTLVKQAVNLALETTLTEGVRTERMLFNSTFALDDQKEGMHAFLEKRDPQFKHR
jgi:enoyl-CoA hydratase